MVQRRTRRFKLQLPLSITRSRAGRMTLNGFTKNISSRGVLFTAETQLDLGGPIEYVIVLSHDGAQSVSLRCMGKVMRADRVGSNSGEDGPNFHIAATLERYEFVRGPQRVHLV
jgi:hypothetical protein